MRSFVSKALLCLLFLLTNREAFSEEKIELDVKLTYVETVDSLNFVRVIVTDKNSDGGVPVPNVLCNLFLSEVSMWGMQGSQITDSRGAIEFPLVNKFRIEDQKLDQYIFILKIANDERFTDINDTTVVQKGEMEVAYGDRSISVKLFEQGEEGEKIPIANAKVRLHVQTTKGLKEIKNQRTATNQGGQATVFFNDDYPAYSGNYVDLLVRVHSADHGIFEAFSSQKWGLNKRQWNKKVSSNHAANIQIALILGLSILVSIGVYWAWKSYRSQY